jgi:aminoacyl tRNA synthase complex-interacting multifunctional protein 1
MSNSVDLVDALIAQVRNAPAASTGGFQHESTDVFWDPSVPCGHTAFTWGVGPELYDLETTAAPSPAPASAPVAAVTATPAESAPAKQPQEKKQKQKKPKKAPKPTPAETPHFFQLDIKVGTIVECKKHPGAERLYIEKIDIGEAEPRQIVSGLVQHIPLDQMLNARCLVIANLKPSELPARSGVTSYGMVLCAADGADKKVVKFVEPPAGSSNGTRVFLENPTEAEMEYSPKPEVNPKKKNHAWRVCAPLFKTNAEGFAMYDGRRFATAEGVCSETGLPNGLVS